MDYSGFTVMLVDDEEAVLKSLARVLRPLQCDVVAFSSPVSAIESMDGSQADLVISDMRMPEMGGEVFLETVAGRWPDTERIVMTGYADVQASIDAINRGKVSRFLTKPWDDDELLQVVRKGFELAKLRRENAELQVLTERKNRELEQLNASLEQKVRERTVQLRAANEGLKSSYRAIVRMFSTLTARRMGVRASEQNQILNLLLLGVAKACKVEGNQLKQLYYAWQLRHIGKLSLSDDLLNQPYVELSAEQQRQFQNHPLLAQAATLLVKPLHGAGKIIVQHKEYLDGTGYPRGLKGESIHRLARILCVVNDYIELTTGTYQERAFSTIEAIDYLKNYATERYDDDVVVALEGVVNSLSKSDGLTKDNSVVSQELNAGMKLSRDLISGQGILLLSAGQQLDDATIERVREIEFNLGETFSIYVQKT
ncbi:response regulator [Pontibacterium granulatum]|uniref:HD domain-containing phosphohydrolase n=1 Tax=Pontibacterium granulatum TaxID=2036029 RepID=UPI00249C9488|nr:HD domain-containing phosphohydrolase [Pontibacterium granulatum]MDI3324950.1 response regulator [Pontibacterium granulatum]